MEVWYALVQMVSKGIILILLIKEFYMKRIVFALAFAGVMLMSAPLVAQDDAAKESDKAETKEAEKVATGAKYVVGVSGMK